jgi:hypothetical protein
VELFALAEGVAYAFALADFVCELLDAGMSALKDVGII